LMKFDDSRAFWTYASIPDLHIFISFVVLRTPYFQKEIRSIFLRIGLRQNIDIY